MHVTFFRNARHTALGLVQQKRNMLGLKNCCIINFDVSCFGPEIFMKIVHAKSQSLWLEVGYPQFCHFSAVMHVTLVPSFILTKLKKVEL